MGELRDDPVVKRMREQISDNDRELVEAINKRLKLVARLSEYKLSRGYRLVDEAREDWMVRYLARTNGGPLSSEGLRAIYAMLLDVTKQEIFEERAVEDGRG